MSATTIGYNIAVKSMNIVNGKYFCITEDLDDNADEKLLISDDFETWETAKVNGICNHILPGISYIRGVYALICRKKYDKGLYTILYSIDAINWYVSELNNILFIDKLSGHDNVLCCVYSFDNKKMKIAYSTNGRNWNKVDNYESCRNIEYLHYDKGKIYIVDNNEKSATALTLHVNL